MFKGQTKALCKSIKHVFMLYGSRLRSVYLENWLVETVCFLPASLATFVREPLKYQPRAPAFLPALPGPANQYPYKLLGRLAPLV